MSSLLNPDVTRATSVSPEIDKTIDDMFTYHAWGPEQMEKGAAVRNILAEAVRVIVANVPPSPDRSDAIRKIRDARMAANSAITHEGKY